jgi:hypothetical protein
MLFSVCMAEEAESSRCLWCAMLILIWPCVLAERSWYVVQGGCCCSRKGKCRCQCRYVRWSPVQRARGATVSGMRAEEVAGGSCRVSTMSQVCQGGSNEGQRMCSLQKEKLKKCEDTVVVVSEFPGIRTPPFPTRPASGQTRVLVRILCFTPTRSI